MKRSRLLIIASTVLLSLTGCDKGPTKTKIVIWTTYNDSYQTIINNCIEEFRTLEPDIYVENIKQTGSYQDLATKVTDGFAVDNYPDMCATYPDSANDFVMSVKALDVTQYMNDPEIGWTEDDFEDIPENYIELGQQYMMPGTYSLPASKSTEAMYYNQDVLVGLDLSAQDASINGGQPLNDNYIKNITWEEMFGKLIPALELKDAALRAAGQPGLIDKDTNAKWAWLGYDSDDNMFITLAAQYGYGYTSVDSVTGQGQIDFVNDGMKNLMKQLKGYYDNHYFTTSNAFGDRVNNGFTKDQMLFSIGSTGGVKYQFADANAHNVGVAPVPYPVGGQRKLIAQGPDFAFLNHKNPKRAEAVWKFFKLFTSTKYNTAWALETGYSPIRYSVKATEDYMAYSDYESKDPKTFDRLTALNAYYSSTVTDYLFSSPVFKGSAEARKQVGTIFNACVVAGANLNAKIDDIFQTAYDNTLLKM